MGFPMSFHVGKGRVFENDCGLTNFTFSLLIEYLLTVTAPHHDESYSPHKDRSSQRFRVEKFSDSGNSRRFDYQEQVPVTGGFMTSTPQTKPQAVFSPPKSSQVHQQFYVYVHH